jgi:transcriptional regulator with XRE-family HTH domain
LKSDDPSIRMFGSLGLALRVFREQAGLTQAEVARRAAVGKSRLSLYERGKQLPSLDSLARVLAALGTTPLVFQYVCSVLDRATPSAGGLRAELLDQGAETFLNFQEASQYRKVFDQFLRLFESAAEARMLIAFTKTFRAD